MATAGASTTSATNPHQLSCMNTLSTLAMGKDNSRIKDVLTLDNPQEIKEELKQEFKEELNVSNISGFEKDLNVPTYVRTENVVPGEDEEPVIDIMINNVVCSFSVACHLDLRNIALSGNNVEFRRENGMVTMKLRRPPTTASIWSSGKITCTGSTSEGQARMAARRIARSLQKLGYNVKFRNFRIVNVLGTCTMPFAIKITPFSQKFKPAACYEPELHPGVTYKIDYPKATLKIFSTGSITVTAPSINNVQSAIEHIYPLVREFGKARTEDEMAEFRRNQARRHLAMTGGIDLEGEVDTDSEYEEYYD